MLAVFHIFHRQKRQLNKDKLSGFWCEAVLTVFMRILDTQISYFKIDLLGTTVLVVKDLKNNKDGCLLSSHVGSGPCPILSIFPLVQPSFCFDWLVSTSHTNSICMAYSSSWWWRKQGTLLSVGKLPWHYILQDSHLFTHCCEILKFYLIWKWKYCYQWSISRIFLYYLHRRQSNYTINYCYETADKNNAYLTIQYFVTIMWNTDFLW